MPHDELQYHSLIRSVLDNGESRSDITGADTISLFAPPSLRFSLADSTIPLFTTTKIFPREIIEELLWLVKGKTDSNLLSNGVVKTWDGNGSKEFLERQGLGHRRAGDLGPVYGFQWRHFGAEYADADTDYSGKGVDQLREVIRKIIEDPTDRRIILSAWNPADIPLMAIPPSHMMCQFYVHLPPSDEPNAPRRLSCLVYQRSADLGLRIPSDIASYALLTHMIARVTGTQPHELIIQLGDAYVCRDHVEALTRLLTREPHPFPTLRWTRDVTDIEDFTDTDFAVEEYSNPYNVHSITLESDPDALRVRVWRVKLQKAFLHDKRPAKVENMPECNNLFTEIEQYDKMTFEYLAYSKIGKVMRHIILQPLGTIPCDEEFAFRARAQVLVDKWHTIIHNAKDGEGSNAPATAPPEADKAEEDATNEAAATSTADVPVAGGTTDVTDGDGDVDADGRLSNSYVYVLSPGPESGS